MSDYIYIRFTYENHGYQPGDVVKAELNQRDNLGVHVTMRDNSPEHLGALINSWSDLGCFEELTAMEVIAHAATGVPFL